MIARDLSLVASRLYRMAVTQTWVTCRRYTLKRSSKHPGHPFNMMVGLHPNCQKDQLCHQLCPQRTSLEVELKHSMSAQSEESTIIRWNVMRIAHLKAFQKPKIGLTGLATWIIRMTAKTIAQQTLDLILSKAMVSRIRNAQSSGMWVLCQMFPDWFGQHGSQRDSPKRCWWQVMQQKRGGTREWRKSRTQCVNVSPASLHSVPKSFG